MGKVAETYFRNLGIFGTFDPKKGGKTMELEQVDREVKNFFALVPSPAEPLTGGQKVEGRSLFEEPQGGAESYSEKIRELIGIALSALTSCPHCAFYHTQLARAGGATESEIEDALREPERFLEKKKLLPLVE
jgi:AhpD family alkylhydroperoxidase